MSSTNLKSKTAAAIQYAQQAERLSGHPHSAQKHLTTGSTTAYQAKFITPHDPVIETVDGHRLPSVPLEEAHKLNRLKNEVEGIVSEVPDTWSTQRPDMIRPSSTELVDPDATLREATPPSRTNPLFPPLPLYGPATWMRDLQCLAFRVSSAILSLNFLLVIVLGAAFTSIPSVIRHILLRLIGKDPDAGRPFYKEEQRRKEARKVEVRKWDHEHRRRNSHGKLGDDTEDDAGQRPEFIPSEGGKDPLRCDVAYYARRVGLDIEEYSVQTEDGFIIQLWHVYDPKKYKPKSAEERQHRGPNLFQDRPQPHDNGTAGGHAVPEKSEDGKSKYPVLLVHGLLQSAGAYCSNDDDSLAFFLCKSGYDVWLGNNRSGFQPRHTLLSYADPRMWAWNIRQMGVMDLPAMISRVLAETGFSKLGLVCHSQGTTQTFVALAKGQRPDLGDKISVFCALAPAVYAGPLIGKAYFKFMRVISPGLFRIIFGIHAFIPFMMTMHGLLPGRLYGFLGYQVFSFLFNWTDDRWDRALRDRCFQFAPVYVSAESMRWWLGRECFAKQKCILATREEVKREEAELRAEEEEDDKDESPVGTSLVEGEDDDTRMTRYAKELRKRGSRAWYDERAPPMALWVGGSDQLVDGKRLLRRFNTGREPHVQVVHQKIIEEYEHLDVLWAMDSIERIGKEIREVIWKTLSDDTRASCVVPRDCDGVTPWTPKRSEKTL